MALERVYENTSKCCGCGACMNACPKNAITMEYSKDGYMYPVINQEICIGCGLCQKKCHYNDTAFVPETFADKEMDIYAAQGDAEATSRSTSGGMFYLLAKNVLSRGGVVYGAAYDENMVARHIEITDESHFESCNIGAFYD